MTLHGVKLMSGDILAQRMDDMHERWDAMELHIEQQFHEYAKAYKLDLSKNDDESWVSEFTSVAAAAFFGGWHCRHESNLNYAKEFAP